jgi:Tol biopolymer transport system component
MLIGVAFLAVQVIYAPSRAEAVALRPHIFLPGVISTAAPDIAPAFVKSGRALFFSRRVNNRWSVLQSEYRAGFWSPPALTSFSGTWNDLEAAAAPSGRYVVFASDRPERSETARLIAHYYGKEQVGGALWRVTLTGNSSGALVLLPNSINEGTSVWTPSIAANDDLAFMRTDIGSGRFRLFLAKADGKGGYRSVQPLAFSTGAANDVDPAIDPAERFLVFSSDRDTPGQGGEPGPEHLFIAYSPLSANPEVCPLQFAGWSDPSVSEVEPRLSPDGRQLYFASRHLDHELGQPASGPWDNGKANIWVLRFSSETWRHLTSHSNRCATATALNAARSNH